ncbi:MAG: ABC transporter permease [Rhizobiaceae bacterium]|nr:ABC transporter permease [Rhizobiaceae bacterium]
MVVRLESTGIRLGAYLVTAIGLAIIYLPPLYLLAFSFNESLQPALPGISDLSLKWYIELANEGRLLSALRESLMVAFATSIVATIVALFAALAYLEMGKWRGSWFLFVTFSMFVPGVIQGLALSVIFSRTGIKPFWGTVAAGHLLWSLPFAFTVILTSLGIVKRSYLLAAADLGASWFRRLWEIIIPLTRPGLAGAFIFCFLLSLNEYNRAFYLVGRQNTLPIVMFGKMNSGASPTIYALSGAILIASFVAVIFVLLFAGSKSHK